MEQKRLEVFAERFNKLRGKRSQDAFAKFLGISRPTVGFYENGERLPDALVLKQIAQKCGVTSDYLLGLSDIPTNDRDLQFVCEYTGLSEEAVGILRDKELGKAGRETQNVVLNEVLNDILSESNRGSLKRLQSDISYIFWYEYEDAQRCAQLPREPLEVKNGFVVANGNPGRANINTGKPIDAEELKQMKNNARAYGYELASFFELQRLRSKAAEERFGRFLYAFIRKVKKEIRDAVNRKQQEENDA